MNTLIEDVLSRLVDLPDQIVITTVPSKESVTYEVRVAPSDIGKVIGKQGRIANAVRTVVKAAAMKQEQKVYIAFIGSAHPAARLSE